MEVSTVLDTLSAISNCLGGLFLLSGMFKKSENQTQALLALWTAHLAQKKAAELKNKSAQLLQEQLKETSLAPAPASALTPVQGQEVALNTVAFPVANEVHFSNALLQKMHAQERSAG